MNKRNITKIGVFVLKAIAILVAVIHLPEVKEVVGIPAAWAAVIFGVASASKEVVLVILDAIDDGKINNSFSAETVKKSVSGIASTFCILCAIGVLTLTSVGCGVEYDPKTDHLLISSDSKSVVEFADMVAERVTVHLNSGK
jgi:hypothetical protein